MPRKCSVCAHPDLAEINAAIIRGDSLRDIARQYHLSKDAVARHSKKHLPVALAKAKDASEVASADDLLSQVRDLRDRTLSILSEAETAGKLPVALKAIQVAQGNIELLAKLLIEVEKHRLADIERKSDVRDDLAGMSNEELEERMRILRDGDDKDDQDK